MKHEWFYMKGANKHGPVNSSRLRELADSGQLLPTDLVWREGMNDWKRARKIDGLFDAVSQPQKQADPWQVPVKTPPKRPPAPPSNMFVIQTAAGPSSPPPADDQPAVDRMFQCPYCRREMIDDPSLAGMAVACPHCGQNSSKCLSAAPKRSPGLHRPKRPPGPLLRRREHVALPGK